MGKRGPAPKERILRVMSGNLPLKQEYGSPAQITLHKPPEMPENLIDEEKVVWNKTLELLLHTHAIEKLDAAILAAYCSSFVRWRTAEDEIQKLSKTNKLAGLIVKKQRGWEISPLIVICRRERADTAQYAAQLGMTPAARLRVQMIQTPAQENPFIRIKAKNGLDTKGEALREVLDDEE